MVFLAVSGLTFLIAASFINGKVAQTEYTQGMHQTNLQIRTIINNVINDNYPLPYGDSLRCAITPAGPNVTTTAPAANGVAVIGCTFAGSVIEPDYNGNGQQYYLYSVAGCQFSKCSISNTSLPPSNLEEEMPQVIDSLSGSKAWEGGIVLSHLYIVQSNNWTTVSALGIFGSLYNMNNGVMESGAQPVSLVYFIGPSSQTAQHIASLGKGAPDGYLLNSGYVVMCFRGSANQAGSVEIGSNNGGQQLTTQLIMGQKVPSQCLS